MSAMSPSPPFRAYHLRDNGTPVPFILVKLRSPKRNGSSVVQKIIPQNISFYILKYLVLFFGVKNTGKM